MPKRQKSFAGSFDRLQKRLEQTINTVPVLEKALTKVYDTKTARFLTDKAKNGRRHINLILKDFPSDLASVKPYLQVQKKNFKAWGKSLKPTPDSNQRRAVKSKIKAKRPGPGPKEKLA